MTVFAGSVEVLEVGPPAESIMEDVWRGLSKAQKELPCKYLYDEAGSALFDRICWLDEYYLTAKELEIMHRHAPEMAEAIGPRCMVIEPGSGSGLKARLLLAALRDPAAYVPIDISRRHLVASAESIARRFPAVEVLPVWADFTTDHLLPVPRRGERRRAVYFPGSTFGNFGPQARRAMFRRFAEMAGPGGGLLLGVDLQKDPAVLEAAYNDEEGVTAAFNLNILKRVNRELGAEFDVDAFEHRAFYNAGEQRIEMHLVSRRDQSVPIDGRRVRLDEGETIRTECSYKFTVAQVGDSAATEGFRVRASWTDEAGWFAVLYMSRA